MEEWHNVQDKTKPEHIYIGATCALYATLNFDGYSNGDPLGDYVSLLFLVNSIGSDKKEVAVFGKSLLNNVSSVPVKYYFNEAQVSVSGIYNHLSTWNEKLKTDGKDIKLFLSLPEDVTDLLTFTNIKIINPTGDHFVENAIKKIVTCFKYHYRKLQIIKNIVHGENSELQFSDYINVISAAWHNVSTVYILELFNTGKVKNKNENEEEMLSLSDWCLRYNVPINSSSVALLDKFAVCDEDLPNFTTNTNDERATPYEFHKVNSPASSIEAYEAMKRLISYMQSANAEMHLIESAKTLEGFFEQRALLEIKDIVTTMNSEQCD